MLIRIPNGFNKYLTFDNMSSQLEYYINPKTIKGIVSTQMQDETYMCQIYLGDNVNLCLNNADEQTYRSFIDWINRFLVESNQ